MVEKSSKYIENKCSHWAFRPITIGIHAHRKGILDMLDLGRKAIASNFSVFLHKKNTEIAKDKSSHCAMALDYSF